jgi:hypothetical protein
MRKAVVRQAAIDAVERVVAGADDAALPLIEPKR